MKINRLEISGFKSIDKLTLTDLNHFMIFAGPNGSGKSNLFDALKFVSIFVNYGVQYALQTSGGFEYVHCYKKRKDAARTFKFDIVIADENNHEASYSLKIANMDQKEPFITEIYSDGTKRISRRGVAVTTERAESKEETERKRTTGDGTEKDTQTFPAQYSFLSNTRDTPIYSLLSCVRIYRIDPVTAKGSCPIHMNGAILDPNGQNIAKVLSELEKDDKFRNSILELMNLFVPHLSAIGTEQQRLEPVTSLTFKEEGVKKRFPANLVSDGTIYLLCILTTILHPACQYGITLIEEPERGINPKPIEELTNLLRQAANENHFIFVTTHNETLVRSSRAEELAFLYKEDGKTQIKWGRDSADIVKEVPLDTAWLANMFDGGLPW